MLVLGVKACIMFITDGGGKRRGDYCFAIHDRMGEGTTNCCGAFATLIHLMDPDLSNFASIPLDGHLALNVVGSWPIDCHMVQLNSLRRHVKNLEAHI